MIFLIHYRTFLKKWRIQEWTIIHSYIIKDILFIKNKKKKKKILSFIIFTFILERNSTYFVSAHLASFDLCASQSICHVSGYTCMHSTNISKYLAQCCSTSLMECSLKWNNWNLKHNKTKFPPQKNQNGI